MATVLALMAHPDDIEILCAGTLVLLRDAGWRVHLATMTAGDLGSSRLSRAEIAAVRRREAAASAALLDASYSCLDQDDLCVVYAPEVKRLASGLIRHVAPDLLITHSPTDYMADHEETARIAREAAFAAAAPLWQASWRGETPPPCRAPAVLHADPLDLTDSLGAPVAPELLVDVSDVIDRKAEMLACHESQREWLREQHGHDEYLGWMRRMSATRGSALGAGRYAEGFRQSRASGLGREDRLSAALGARVRRP
jgi:LmbE family N-acetylglucosaminyl deacetylase